MGRESGEFVSGNLSAVGLDFDEGDLREESDEVGEFLLLQEGFAAGEDEAVAIVARDERGNFSGRELDDLFCLGEFHPILVFPRSFFPVPGVGGVTPVTVEITERKPQENGGCTEGGAFALQGVKDLGRSIGKA